jgi:hypothetical protein
VNIQKGKMLMLKIANIEKITAQIDSTKHWQKLSDSSQHSDGAFITNTYFIATQKRSLKKVIQTILTDSDNIKIYRLDTLSKGKPIQAKLVVDSLYFIQADIRKTSTYYFSNNKLIKVTMVQTNDDKIVLNGTYYFNNEKKVFRAYEKKQPEALSYIEKSKIFYENAMNFLNVYTKF